MNQCLQVHEYSQKFRPIMDASMSNRTTMERMGRRVKTPRSAVDRTARQRFTVVLIVRTEATTIITAAFPTIPVARITQKTTRTAIRDGKGMDQLSGGTSVKLELMFIVWQTRVQRVSLSRGVNLGLRVSRQNLRLKLELQT